ncbi:hypothetical protein D3C81_728700 [compost metagenome]
MFRDHIVKPRATDNPAFMGLAAAIMFALALFYGVGDGSLARLPHHLHGPVPHPRLVQALVGAGVPANTGGAGAIHRVGFFAGMPAPTGTVQVSGSCSTCGNGLPTPALQTWRKQAESSFLERLFHFH